ncbi:MAG: Fic family protein [Symploca sp. SIO2E6]|nr:Fic family protein [Symploca sp. SIO2E6]
MPKFVDKDVVIAIHKYLINEFGGKPGILDEGLLESALAQPQQTFFDLGNQHEFDSSYQFYNQVTSCVVSLGFAAKIKIVFMSSNNSSISHVLMV